jgi:hypothetical protein
MPTIATLGSTSILANEGFIQGTLPAEEGEKSGG